MTGASAHIWETAAGDLLARAQADPGFHALCRTDPARAFRAAAGFELPGSLKLRFQEVGPGELLVALPPLQLAAAAEPLSDEDLAGVAGGTWVLATAGVGLCAAGFLAATVYFVVDQCT